VHALTKIIRIKFDRKKKTPWRIKLLKKKHNLKSNRDRKERKKKYKDQFLINQILKVEIEIIQFRKGTKKNQYVLTFETGDSGHEYETNPIATKKI
jgi:hypothetical protein